MNFIAVSFTWIIILSLSGSLNCHAQQQSANGFVSIFDGRTLNDWEGDSTYWRIENGILTGEVTPATLLKRNSFIIWRGGTPGDFELMLEYRISSQGNSGVNYRSEAVEGIPYALRGYQCDIDGANRYTGQNYEERGRTTLAYRGQKVVLNQLPDSVKQLPVSRFIEKNAWTKSQVEGSLGEPEEFNRHINDEDWNTCHIVAKGNRLKHYINGILMSDVTDKDKANRNEQGLIGVQVHVGPPMKVEYRNIRLKRF